jgi:hypothetical protein
MKDGDAYVNVHTLKNPAGEIRGQIGVGVQGRVRPAPSAAGPDGEDDFNERLHLLGILGRRLGCPPSAPGATPSPGETRLRLATYDGVRWRAPTTLMTSLATIGRVAFLGRTATIVRWSLENLDDTRPHYFEAHRKGTSWTSPHVLAHSLRTRVAR